MDYSPASLFEAQCAISTVRSRVSSGGAERLAHALPMLRVLWKHASKGDDRWRDLLPAIEDTAAQVKDSLQ